MKDLITIHKEEGLETKELSGLYLIRNLDTNALKIGITNNLQSRFKDLIATFKHVGISPRLKVECFLECEIKVYSRLERMLHKKFKKYNIQNEWFDIRNIDNILEYTMSLDESVFDNNSTTYKNIRILKQDSPMNILIPNDIDLKKDNIKIIPTLCYLYIMTNIRGISFFAINNIVRYLNYTPKRGAGKINDNIKKSLIKLIQMGLINGINETQIKECGSSEMMECRLCLPNTSAFNLDINTVEKILFTYGRKAFSVLTVYCSLLIKSSELNNDVLNLSDLKDLKNKMAKNTRLYALKMLQELNLIELIN